MRAETANDFRVNSNTNGWNISKLGQKWLECFKLEQKWQLDIWAHIIFKSTLRGLQEYYIRRMDGYTVDIEGEKEKVIKCLEAAIRRRISEGLSLELCAKDRVGLLSDVTRVLRENGLSVMRAGVTTVGEQAMHVFYVSDAAGNPVNMKTIQGLREEIGHTMMLNVKKVPTNTETLPLAKTSLFFRSLLEKFRS